jgi:hypothetical protein
MTRSQEHSPHSRPSSPVCTCPLWTDIIVTPLWLIVSMVTLQQTRPAPLLLLLLMYRIEPALRPWPCSKPSFDCHLLFQKLHSGGFTFSYREHADNNFMWRKNQKQLCSAFDLSACKVQPALKNWSAYTDILFPMSHQCNQSSRGDMQGFISFWRIDSITSMQMDPSNRHIRSWKWRYWRAYMAATANTPIIPSCGGIPALLIRRSIHCSSFVSVPKVW